MRSTQIVSLLFLLSSCYANLNQVYKDYLHGKVALTEEITSQMYLDFLKEYKLSPKGREQSEFLKQRGALSNRYGVFEENIKSIIQHNTDGSKTFKQGINSFSDFTFEEFSSYYNLNDTQDKCSATNGLKQEVPGLSPLEEVPEFYDWREHSGVTPVKDQGSCGSCWTFSTVGALEAHYLINTGEITNLAEQQLVDCAGDFDNYGCSGGLPSHAFQYIKYNGGLADETQYPYTAVDGECYSDSARPMVTDQGSHNITVLDEVELMQHLYSFGPVSVAFQVYSDFKSYESGVYTSSECGTGPEDVNHAVLAVGFGTDEETGLDYWIVKNSWGTTFGIDGYFLIERGNNVCGIAQCNSYPIGVKAADAMERAFLQ